MRIAGTFLVAGMMAMAAAGQLVISGNESKIDLTSGTAVVLPDAPPDSISILDFSSFPPKVTHLDNIRNSVIGPPSNIAITPDEGLALIASSTLPDPANPGKWIPDNVIHVLDLTLDPPAVIDVLEMDPQPSGMSIARDGSFALVANRAAGTVSMLSVDGKKVAIAQTVTVCTPEDQVSDVSIGPDGTIAVASVNMGGYLALLKIEDGKLTVTDRKFSVYGSPYRCAISPDGAFALTAGSGQGLPDEDALTVIDLSVDPPRTTDYVPIGSGPESFEISPDGRLVAAVLMEGSSFAKDDPRHEENGKLTILARRGSTFRQIHTLPTGPIPEGVAFSPDGKYIIVQCHPTKELWFYRVNGERVTDTGERITVPGMPSSLRAAEKP
jgi:DNA-binding beta-propeller fold protein YncE